MADQRLSEDIDSEPLALARLWRGATSIARWIAGVVVAIVGIVGVGISGIGAFRDVARHPESPMNWLALALPVGLLGMIGLIVFVALIVYYGVRDMIREYRRAPFGYTREGRAVSIAMLEEYLLRMMREEHDRQVKRVFTEHAEEMRRIVKEELMPRR